MIQCDFFESDDNLILKDQLRQLKESQDKVRNSLYARNGELQKKYDDLLQRLQVIEENICRT